MLSWLLGVETEAERALQLHIDKATSIDEVEPAQSDIAAIVEFTWDQQSSLSVWIRFIRIADLYQNSVVDHRLFKALIVLFHVLQCGHPSVFVDARSLSSGISNWSHFERLLLHRKAGYRFLDGGYEYYESFWSTFGALLQAKLHFHRKYSIAAYSQIELPDNQETGQTMIVKLMRLQDNILLYLAAVGIPLHSAKVKMASLVPLIRESSAILQCVTRLLQNFCIGPTIPPSIQKEISRFCQQHRSCHRFFASYRSITWLARHNDILPHQSTLPEFAQAGTPTSAKIKELESHITAWQRRHAADNESKTRYRAILKQSLEAMEQNWQNDAKEKDAEMQKLKQRLAISEKKYAAISELHKKLQSDHNELLSQLEGWKLVPISETNDLLRTSRAVNRVSVTQSTIARAAFPHGGPNESVGSFNRATGSMHDPTISQPQSQNFASKFTPTFHGIGGQVDNAVFSGTPVHPNRNSWLDNRVLNSWTDQPSRNSCEVTVPRGTQAQRPYQPRSFTNPDHEDDSHEGGHPVHVYGGKPVIYLYPPVAMDVSVRLSLGKEWRFSAIYPVVPARNIPFGQIIEWNVHAQSNGLLTENLTGLDVSYLYWEAMANKWMPDSPPPSRVSSSITGIEKFVPAISQCFPDNSVLLTIEDIPTYLDRALFALGLHTEARTSFVTYWLPSLLKHAYIAIRFVPQASYEEAAPMEVKPTPDLVTRVFMLFQGVKEEDLGVWSKASERATEPASMWKDIVGVDGIRQQDESLFRVLEWGGMELPVS